FCYLAFTFVRLSVPIFASREVAAFGRDTCEAFIQALVATGFKLPQTKILISFAVDSMRAEFLPWAKEFIRMGYTFVGTPGTAEYYCKHGVRKKPKRKTILCFCFA
ncbi:unnamed protein product, partial [Laminaria digitata]